MATATKGYNLIFFNPQKNNLTLVNIVMNV
jgi:hypothetical protein